MSELWEAEARRYDAGYDGVGREGRLVRARQAEAIALLGDGPGRVLDVGMGGGRLCVALAELGWEVSGVDPSEAMVALARSRLADAELVVGRAESLPFPDGSFDAAAALGSLEYAADLDAALREIARVLRRQGRAVLSWPNFRGLTPLWRGRVLYPSLRLVKRVVPVGRRVPPPSRRALSLEAFLGACASAGLTHESVVYLDPHGRRAGAVRGSQVLCALVLP
jgi:SAM-dependent methyltransferase